MLARGGVLARGAKAPLTSTSSLLTDTTAATAKLKMKDPKAMVDYQLAKLLADQDLSVIAPGAEKVQAGKINSRTFCLPYLDADFHQIFPKIDLVVHHGKALLLQEPRWKCQD